MEEASGLRESATDVAEAMSEIEGYMQRLKDLAIEVCTRYFAVPQNSIPCLLWSTESDPTTQIVQRLRPVYTGDFCRATQCNFCRAEVASSRRDIEAIKSPWNWREFVNCMKSPRYRRSFEPVRNLMQLQRDKNCIELRDKNRLCKRALKIFV